MPKAHALFSFPLIVALANALAAQDVPKVPPPDPGAAEVPPGYRVEVAVDQLMYPSSIEIDRQGALYVAECGHMPGDDGKPARILKITGKAQSDREVLAADLAAPITDLLWHDGKLLVSHRTKISVVEGGRLRDLVTDLPSLGDHSNNQLCVGPDGKLYFGQGSATNAGVVGTDNFAFGWVKDHPEVCETVARDVVLAGQEFETADPRGGDQVMVKTSAFHPYGKTAAGGAVVKARPKPNCVVYRVAPDGSGLEVYAWGFRNPYGIAWGADGKLYVADAGSDERGSRHVANAPEKLWSVKKDAWYGWPDFEGGIPVTDPRYAPKKAPAPRFLMKEHPPVEKPFMTFESHASITQIDVCRSAKFGFEGQLFLGASGDQTPATAPEEVRAGYWVRRVDVASGKAETFFRTKPEALGPKGAEYVATAGPKRIVDVKFSPQGDALYVVDIGPVYYVKSDAGPKAVAFPGTGVVWKITRAP
jgi:glucose/arabinose dehydrogenase